MTTNASLSRRWDPTRRPVLLVALAVLVTAVGLWLQRDDPARPPTTQDYGCPAGISVTREYRPGRGATPEAAVDALIAAWYSNVPGQSVERLPVPRPGEPGSATYLIRREGEPFETIVVRRAPYQGRNGYEATLDQVCGSHADEFALGQSSRGLSSDPRPTT